MKANSLVLAQRYALAYDSLAKDAKEASSNYEHLEQALLALKEAGQYLLSPVISNKVKEDILAKILKKSEAAAFIKILVDAKRFDLSALILKQLSVLLDKRNGVTRVKVSSCGALKDADKKILEKALSSYFNAKAALDFEEDSTLLGGLIIRRGDILIDASAQGRIKQLTKNLTER